MSKEDRVELSHNIEEPEKIVQKLEEQQKSDKLSKHEKVLNITTVLNLVNSISNWIKFFK